MISTFTVTTSTNQSMLGLMLVYMRKREIPTLIYRVGIQTIQNTASLESECLSVPVVKNIRTDQQPQTLSQKKHHAKNLATVSNALK